MLQIHDTRLHFLGIIMYDVYLHHLSNSEFYILLQFVLEAHNIGSGNSCRVDTTARDWYQASWEVKWQKNHTIEHLGTYSIYLYLPL